MKKEISSYEFSDEMINHGFSYEGSKVLFAYLDEIDGTIEFDPIAFRCQFTEYASFKELCEDYDNQNFPSIEELSLHTTVLEVGNGSIIIEDF